jgi:hypothetical protein
LRAVRTPSENKHATRRLLKSIASRGYGASLKSVIADIRFAR